MPINPMDLTGAKILITGASSGLGRESAVMMSKLGARLFIMGRSEERLGETLSRLEGDGHESLAFDLSEVGEIVSTVTDLAKSFGGFSGIVHSAGIVETRPIRISQPKTYEDIYKINVVAASQLLRATTKQCVISDTGCSVVLIGSFMSLVGASGLAAYATSKSALLGLVRTAALELAKNKIRVNAVLPGQFATPMTEHQRKRLEEEQIQQIDKMHPLGVGQVEDVASCVAFLISPAARWVTGSGLVVDGGYTAQ